MVGTPCARHDSSLWDLCEQSQSSGPQTPTLDLLAKELEVVTAPLLPGCQVYQADIQPTHLQGDTCPHTAQKGESTLTIHFSFQKIHPKAGIWELRAFCRDLSFWEKWDSS